ncbi:hypothetical protein [Shimia abyssi]|uniref:Uncharacterized protein n=1 Tax=Shimia abyssi TaxID=1662395 RepID=A0A2P8F7E9_9RHOB|nr:hypothetical protein [Shimia abyssi]PSL17602.1 hypothetical protein CLV88_11649 [Shimia abyssi]
MPDRFDKKIIDAKALEERLVADGCHLDAQIVGRLRKAARATHNTLRLAHRDNMELREKIKKIEFLLASDKEPK